MAMVFNLPSKLAQLRTTVTNSTPQFLLVCHIGHKYYQATSIILMGLFHLAKDIVPSDATLLMGFAGFGNVGFNVMNHLAETLDDIQTVGVWGGSSWFHKGRLETPVTMYYSPSKNLCLVVPRVPFPVTVFHFSFWEALIAELFDLDLRRYIILGGLREVTRRQGDNEWVAWVPSPMAAKDFQLSTTFGEDLAMIGPLSCLITQGFMGDRNVLAMLAYCNDDDDVEASSMALQELAGLLELDLPEAPLHRFDFQFVPSAQALLLNALDDDEDEELVFDTRGAFSSESDDDEGPLYGDGEPFYSDDEDDNSSLK